MRLFSYLIMLLPFTACSVLGPDVDYPEQAREQISSLETSAPADPATQVSLTDLIAPDRLSPLIEEALNANPGLQQVLATLEIQQQNWRQTHANRLPSADFDFTANKTESADESYSGALNISWQLALWQKLTDRSHAANKDIEEQAFLYEAARNSLAAEVINSWLGLIGQQRAISIQEKRVEALRRTESFIVQRYRNGLGTLDDLDGARSSTASAEANLEAYRESLAQQQRSLALLLGRTEPADLSLPEHFPDEALELSALPEQNLAGRPDLKAAYAAVEAADLRSVAAYKDLLPSISLQAALQDVAQSPSQALLTNPVWTFLGQLTAPLYRGGALKAEAKIAELQSASTYQAYRETLLTAVKDVGDTLGLERSLTKQQQHIEVALKSAQNSLEQYRRSYRSGLVDLLNLLTIERQSYDLEIQLNDITYQRLSNRVNLGLALGLGVQQ